MFTGIIEEIGFVRHVISGSDSGEIQIGARRSPMFKPGKALKESVEG